jgi:hypothetical protein
MLRYICRKSTALAAALLYAALAVIGSTYAWITSSDTVVNTMEQSGFFDAAIVETFLPVTGWKPGTQAEKIVSACNAGTYDAVVRMSFEEILRTLDVPAQPYDEPAPSGAVPEHCPAGAYAGWADAADAFAAVVLPAGSPAGLAVKAEPSSAVAGGYRFAAYRALADGNAQRVTADFAVNPAGDTLTVSGVKYWSYGG